MKKDELNCVRELLRLNCAYAHDLALRPLRNKSLRDLNNFSVKINGYRREKKSWSVSWKLTQRDITEENQQAYFTREVCLKSLC